MRSQILTIEHAVGNQVFVIRFVAGEHSAAAEVISRWRRDPDCVFGLYDAIQLRVAIHELVGLV